MVRPLWKTVLRFPMTFKLELPHDPAILLLGVDQKRLEWGFQDVSPLPCALQLCSQQISIDKIHMSINRWMDKYSIYTQWSIILPLKKEILPFLTISMNQEDVMLIEISQSYKDKYCMISLWETHRIREYMTVTKGRGRGNVVLIFNWNKVSVIQDELVLKTCYTASCLESKILYCAPKNSLK